MFFDINGYINNIILVPINNDPFAFLSSKTLWWLSLSRHSAILILSNTKSYGEAGQAALFITGENQ